MALINSDNDRIIIFALLVAILFFCCILPRIESLYDSEEQELVETMANGLEIKCSPKCCKHTQWLPEDMKQEDNDYVGSNLTCDHGCLCVEKEDIDTLKSRGGNHTCSKQ